MIMTVLFQLALIVAQQRDKHSNKLSGIKLSALSLGLRKVFKAAKEKKGNLLAGFENMLSRNSFISDKCPVSSPSSKSLNAEEAN